MKDKIKELAKRVAEMAREYPKATTAVVILGVVAGVLLAQ